MLMPLGPVHSGVSVRPVSNRAVTLSMLVFVHPFSIYANIVWTPLVHLFVPLDKILPLVDDVVFAVSINECALLRETVLSSYQNNTIHITFNFVSIYPNKKRVISIN